MITLEAYWKGRDVSHADELTDEIRANAVRTVDIINDGLLAAGRSDIDKLNSGWRPKSINEAVGGAPGSWHLWALAGDIPDDDLSLAEWCMDNPDELKKRGIWMEHPGWTLKWVHWQIVPPGKPPRPQVRIFIPSSAPAKTAKYGTAPVMA